jgi:hypothetical protein
MPSDHPTTTAAVNHAYERASARGYAAAYKAEPNPYPHGTQCWILFERAKSKALKEIEKQTLPLFPE